MTHDTTPTTTAPAAVLSAREMLDMEPEAVLQNISERYEFGERIEYFTFEDIGWLLDYIDVQTTQTRTQSAQLAARDAELRDTKHALRAIRGTAYHEASDPNIAAKLHNIANAALDAIGEQS